MSDQETDAGKEEPTPIPLTDFLEGTPPGSVTSVTDLAEKVEHGTSGVYAAGMEGRSRVLPWEICVLASC